MLTQQECQLLITHMVKHFQPYKDAADQGNTAIINNWLLFFKKSI